MPQRSAALANLPEGDFERWQTQMLFCYMRFTVHEITTDCIGESREEMLRSLQCTITIKRNIPNVCSGLC